jgi:hypothetical protein
MTRGALLLAVALGGIGCAKGVDSSEDSSGSNGNRPADEDPIGEDDENRCSDDLHAIVDGKGNVIKECAPDEGCANGECIPACAAAAENKGNVGCDFVVPTPEFLPYTTQPCFAVFVANTWPKPARLDIRFGGTSLDATTFGRIPNASLEPSQWAPLPPSGLPPDEVAVLFLSSDPYSENAGTSLACPVPSAISSATAVGGTGRGTTFQIMSDYPVSAYDILPFGGALSFLPGAQLILPTSAWGKNYVASLAAVQIDPAVPFLGGQGGPMWIQVVAKEDATTLEILPRHFTGLPSGPGVDVAPGNAVTKYQLSAGEVIQWSGAADPAGSILKSDKPIAFVGGNGELCLHSSTSPNGGGCDSAHQQIAPVSALGFDYAVAPYTTRRGDLEEESILYRVVGTVAGTQLVFDPPVTGAPTTLDVGEVVDFEAAGAFRMQSQDENHPFVLVQLMAGGFVEGGSRPGVTPGTIEGGQLGDEEIVAVLPAQQYQSRYVFFTDPTYGTTNLVLVRVRTQDGFHDVTVDCAGVVDGWKPIGSDGNYEYTEVDLVRVNSVGGCQNGRHVASSKGRFGLVVWGLDAWASYAYPAGAAVAPINTVEVVPVPK